MAWSHHEKIVVIQPSCKAMADGSAGLPPGQRVKRRLQMHLASPTSPAHVAVSSDIMKTSFSATCQTVWLTWAKDQSRSRPR